MEQKNGEKIGNEQLYNMLTGQEVSWQALIYDLINSEQLDPWDVDIALLAQKYTDKIKELEEANFLISSKVLLAAAILLRMKSEILVEKYLKNIDDLLFGKKAEVKKEMERIVIDQNDLPFLYPKTPLPRFKKVSITELMEALNHAINTENRRIKKEVLKKRAELQTDIVLPKMGLNIKDRIRSFYARFLTSYQKTNTKIAYSQLTGNDREEKLACFLPMLHLTNQQRLFLEQEKHFSEIYVWLYAHYKKVNPIDKEMEELAEQLENDEKNDELHEAVGFDNPLANLLDEEETSLSENK